MSPERRAVLILLSLAVTGQGLRYYITRPDRAPGDIQILGSNPARSPSQHAAASEAAHRPLAEGERIEINTASAQELARLPRVGLALAQRIVAYRDSVGPFASLATLDSVSGIGPGMLRVVSPHLAFSFVAGRERSLSTLSPHPPPDTLPTLVNLNSATSAELEKLPLIGPSRAIAIVQWRERHGTFKDMDDLVLVPGVSRRMAEAIRDRIAF